MSTVEHPNIGVGTAGLAPGRRRRKALAVMMGFALGVSALGTLAAAPSAVAAPSVERISGADRYATSVALSRSAFPDPSQVSRVYIAAGTDFADGLSVGPAAAASGAALLLTPTGSLPATTSAEIRRLAPDQIVIAGGAGAVSVSVETALKGLAPQVLRVDGEDRYETSQLIAEHGFASGSPQVFLATGRDFPDALSGGALAARQGAPVLLVDGAKSTLDPSAGETLAALGAATVTALGGAGVVPQLLLEAAAAVTGAKPLRIGGADRYATSAKIAAATGSPSEVLMATGRDFPDSLAAVPLAKRRNAPIVLTVPYCIVASTAPAVNAGSVTKVTLLGGPGAVRGLVGTRHTCLSTSSPASLWAMVDKRNPIRPRTYVPTGMRTVAGSNQQMRSDAAGALERMIAAARAEGAGRMHAASGYRSYSTQQYLYNRAVSRFGVAKADIDTARPGYSEHQTGMAMDVVACGCSCGGLAAFGGTSQSRWVISNAHRFGFIVRYESGYTGITGFKSEPWHLRYVGVELARDYKAGGFHTLEQYLGFPAARHY